MDPTCRSITLAAAFPALANALEASDAALPLVTALRLRRWDAMAQTLALAACRRRDATLAELTQFPLPFYDRPLAGGWGEPLRCRALAGRTLRTLERAQLRLWRDLALRTPPQILECSGAGLMLLSEVATCALELAARYLTDPHVRQGAIVFGQPFERRGTRRDIVDAPV